MKIRSIPRYLSELVSGERKLKIDISFSKQFKILKLEDIKKVENTNTNIYKHLITIDGSGCSGSSAVTDFLAEFSDCTVWGGVDMLVNPDRGIQNGFEVDFFRDVHGIQEMEKVCTSCNKRILNTAIKDYLELIQKYYNENYPSSFYNEGFLYQTKQFLENLIDFTVVYGNGNRDYYAKKLDLNEYRKFAKDYIQSVLRSMPSKDNLVLDAVMSINEPNIDLLKEYFGDFKLIYVWRDPRDIYAEARMIPGNDWVPKDPEVFVKWYLRDCPKYINAKDDSLLTIRFEDFINDYDNVAKDIISFIGSVDGSKQNNYKKYFNPSVSKRNIGKYKSYNDQDAIKYIEKALSDYCYNI